MLDGMPGLAPGNSRVAARAFAGVAACGIRTGLERVAIVRIDDVTGGTATRTIISRLVVGAHEGEHWIEQASLLQTNVDRVGSQVRPKPSRAEEILRRFAGRFFGIWNSDLRS